MVLHLQKIYSEYSYIQEKYEDKRTMDYLFMSSPIPVLTIVGLWFIFVLKLGPWMMRDRKPFQIDRILIFYNALQVCICITLLYLSVGHLSKLSLTCTPLTYNESPLILNCGYCYFLLKIVDLLDTVFFVLKKKYTQITILHLFHHSLMVIGGWIGFKFAAGGHMFYLPFINTIVHVVMYSYYLLTAYDKNYQKSVWWKKYITQLQLFTLLFILYVPILFQKNCDFPKWFTFFVTLQNVVMMTLFANFYYQTYLKKKTSPNTIPTTHLNGNSKVRDKIH